MSGFEEWLNVNNDNDWHSVKIPMLRPVLLEDLGVMLSGELAPLCVEEWRARTAGHGFHYVDGQKVHFLQLYLPLS